MSLVHREGANVNFLFCTGSARYALPSPGSTEGGGKREKEGEETLPLEVNHGGGSFLSRMPGKAWTKDGEGKREKGGRKISLQNEKEKRCFLPHRMGGPRPLGHNRDRRLIKKGRRERKGKNKSVS